MPNREPNSFEEMKSTLDGLAKEIVESKKDNPAALNYSATESTTLSDTINKEILKKFSEAYKSYKFLSTCMVINAKEGGVHMTSNCFWEANLDGCIQYQAVFPAVKIFLNVFVVF